jgi:hypothetical protein
MWNSARYASIGGAAFLVVGIASATVALPLDGLTASLGATSQPAAVTESGTCLVAIDRSAAAGTWQVTYQTLDDGSCVCYAYTGPSSQPASSEKLVADLEQSRRCGPAAAAAPAGPSASGGGGGGGGGSPVGPIVAVAAVAGGIAVGVASGSNDSPGG